MAIAFVELQKVCDYRKCAIMEIIALLSIGVNVLLQINHVIFITPIHRYSRSKCTKGANIKVTQVSKLISL